MVIIWDIFVVLSSRTENKANRRVDAKIKKPVRCYLIWMDNWVPSTSHLYNDAQDQLKVKMLDCWLLPIWLIIDWSFRLERDVGKKAQRHVGWEDPELKMFRRKKNESNQQSEMLPLASSANTSSTLSAFHFPPTPGQDDTNQWKLLYFRTRTHVRKRWEAKRQFFFIVEID